METFRSARSTEPTTRVNLFRHAEGSRIRDREFPLASARYQRKESDGLSALPVFPVTSRRESTGFRVRCCETLSRSATSPIVRPSTLAYPIVTHRGASPAIALFRSRGNGHPERRRSPRKSSRFVRSRVCSRHVRRRSVGELTDRSTHRRPLGIETGRRISSSPPVARARAQSANRRPEEPRGASSRPPRTPRRCSPRDGAPTLGVRLRPAAERIGKRFPGPLTRIPHAVPGSEARGPLTASSHRAPTYGCAPSSLAVIPRRRENLEHGNRIVKSHPNLWTSQREPGPRFVSRGFVSRGSNLRRVLSPHAGGSSTKGLLGAPLATPMTGQAIGG